MKVWLVWTRETYTANGYSETDDVESVWPKLSDAQSHVKMLKNQYSVTNTIWHHWDAWIAVADWGPEMKASDFPLS